MIDRLSGLALGPFFALALAGCQETTQTAARPRVDAPGVPVFDRTAARRSARSGQEGAAIVPARRVRTAAKPAGPVNAGGA